MLSGISQDIAKVCCLLCEGELAVSGRVAPLLQPTASHELQWRGANVEHCRHCAAREPGVSADWWETGLPSPAPRSVIRGMSLPGVDTLQPKLTRFFKSHAVISPCNCWVVSPASLSALLAACKESRGCKGLRGTWRWANKPSACVNWEPLASCFPSLSFSCFSASPASGNSNLSHISPRALEREEVRSQKGSWIIERWSVRLTFWQSLTLVASFPNCFLVTARHCFHTRKAKRHHN